MPIPLCLSVFRYNVRLGNKGQVFDRDAMHGREGRLGKVNTFHGILQGLIVHGCDRQRRPFHSTDDKP
jgi:hypothetical protein